MRTLFYVLLSLWACASITLAQEAPPQPAPPTTPAFQRFMANTFDVPTLAEVLPNLADAKLKPIILQKFSSCPTPPRAELVSLLEHPNLATRLGALEILENLANTDFEFNPWLTMDHPKNILAIQRWKSWSSHTLDASFPLPQSVISDSQLQAYLIDLLSNQPDRAARARTMLVMTPTPSLSYLEDYLSKNPNLAQVERARIRQAQFFILLYPIAPDDAENIARELTFGSRDQLLSALEHISKFNESSLPIYNEFLNSSDPLVRETAIGNFLKLGNSQALPRIKDILAKESDLNVIHATLRSIKDIHHHDVLAVLEPLLEINDEDLLISTLQAFAAYSPAPTNSSQRSSSDKPEKLPKTTLQHIHKFLKDPRWRVRHAAIEFYTKKRETLDTKELSELTNDPDPFVRIAAIHLYSRIDGKNFSKNTLKIAQKYPDTIPVIVASLLQNSADIPKEIISMVHKLPPDQLLQCLGSISDPELNTTYLTHPNKDIVILAMKNILNSDYNTCQKSIDGLTAIAKGNDPSLIDILISSLIAKQKYGSGFSSSWIDQLSKSSESIELLEPTYLDPLYQTFINQPAYKSSSEPSESESSDSPIPSDKSPKIASYKDFYQAIERFLTPETPLKLRFNSATLLVNTNPKAIEILTQDIKAVDIGSKIEFLENVHSESPKLIPIYQYLLMDENADIRDMAISKIRALPKRYHANVHIFKNLLDPNTRIEPSNINIYHFDDISVDSTDYINTILAKPDPTVDHLTLAISAIPYIKSKKNYLTKLESYYQHPDFHVRRAAYFATLSIAPSEISNLASQIAKDPQPEVRETLVSAGLGKFGAFPRMIPSKKNQDQDHYTEEEKLNFMPPSADQGLMDIFRQFALNDPSKQIQFLATFNLLVRNEPINCSDFVKMIPTDPKASYQVKRKLSLWLESNANNATTNLAPIYQCCKDEIGSYSASSKKLHQIFTVANPPPLNLSIADTLKKPLPTESTKPEKPLQDTPSSAPTPPKPRTSIKLVFFYKTGCPECNKTKQYLADLKKSNPTLDIHDYDILSNKGSLFNQTLCTNFSVPNKLQNVAPAIFTQAGYLIKDASIIPLAGLISKTATYEQDDSWATFSEESEQIAESAITERYQSFSLPIILSAGLIDGLNPCAFATIIFFLSYLQIARRSRKEILAVGVAFIAAVFLAYLAAGLVLHESLAWFHQKFPNLQSYLNYTFAGLALLAAILSLRDAYLARIGKLSEMSLQLPKLLKDRIHSTIRNNSKSSHFIIAAFLSGIIISFLELACTGQVYAPIIYQIQQGNQSAIHSLIYYNLAFITPLIAIFLMAFAGLSNQALIQFQKNHTSLIKIALALIFIALAIMILFGHSILPSSLTPTPPH